tara:strand:+ start:737 stop:940 length:204 start_codon:yes stop_codon:yes gene_type:complete
MKDKAIQKAYRLLIAHLNDEELQFTQLEISNIIDIFNILFKQPHLYDKVRNELLSNFYIKLPSSHKL